MEDAWVSEEVTEHSYKTALDGLPVDFSGGRNRDLVDATVSVGLSYLHLHLILINTRHLPRVVEF